MSITTVSAKIKTAMKDAFITTAEAAAIVKTAEVGPVTVGEARAVRELFEKAPRPTPPGMMVTMAIPENPGDVILEAGAKSAIEAFFTRNNVPAGANAKKTIEKIEAKLDQDGFGAELASAPNTKKLHMVRLPYPELVMDYPSRTAFVDSAKNEFYLCVAGGLMAPGPQNTHWYGPLKLDVEPATDKVSDKRAGELRAAFNKVDRAGLLDWKSGGVIENAPLGQRFVRVELMRERHPDGYAFSALIPVGALSPTAVNKDPNLVEEFYIERSGGFAGLTTHVGPLKAKITPDVFTMAVGEGPADQSLDG